MLLSPIPYVPSDKSEGPKFHFRSAQAGTNSTRLVINAVFWLSGLFVALFTALSTPGFCGQGIGCLLVVAMLAIHLHNRPKLLVI